MNAPAVELHLLDPDEIDSYKDGIVQVYCAAFSPPPYSIEPFRCDTFAATLERHIERPYYRCIVALEPASRQVVGFTYGYEGGPGQWWRDAVAAKLPEPLAEQWLTNYFELAELAVDPSRQGHGIGARLHDELLREVPHRTAALSTIQVETVALGLYRRRGWTTILHDFLFPGGDRPYLIMRLDLDGAGARQRP